MKFENRTAFITGAAGKIGRALAEEFGKFGVKLYLADINMPGLEELCAGLKGKGIEAHPVQMDIMDPRWANKNGIYTAMSRAVHQLIMIRK